MNVRGRVTNPNRRLVRTMAILIVVILSTAAVPPGVSAQVLPPTHTEKFVGDWWDVDAEPDFRAETMQKDVPAGRASELSVLVINEGEVADFDAVEEPATTQETTSAEKEMRYDETGTTAKNLVATLEGEGPIEVETSTASAPKEILGGGSVTLPFKITVDEDAASGTYDLDLTVTYRHLEDAAVEHRDGTYQPSFYHRTVTETLPLRVTVEENAIFRVAEVSVAEGELRLGREPTVAVTYENVGKDAAHDAEASLSPGGPFSVEATTDAGETAYLGTVAPGDSVTTRYDLSVSQSGLAKNYSLSSRVSYEDDGGNEERSRALTVPLRVKPFEDRFAVIETEVTGELSPGDSSEVTVTYRNDGERAARDAVARLSVADPFTSTSDTAYLGTLEPGESATGTFRLSASSDALPKTYGVDTEVKYRDRNGLTRISDALTAEVGVAEAGSGPLAAPGPAAPLAAAALIGALLARRRGG